VSRVLNREDAVLIVVTCRSAWSPPSTRVVRAVAQELQITIERPGAGPSDRPHGTVPQGAGTHRSRGLAGARGEDVRADREGLLQLRPRRRLPRAVAKAVRRQVILIGMEAHVCVYQTSVDLINAGV